MRKRSDVTVYHVSSSATTTDEPGAGWYFEDSERRELRGPYATKERAQEAAGWAQDYSYEDEERDE